MLTFATLAFFAQADAAADPAIRYSIYASFTLLVLGGSWLIRHLFARDKEQRAEFLGSLKETVKDFKEVNTHLRNELGERLDSLSEKVHGLDCQRSQRNGKPSC